MQLRRQREIVFEDANYSVIDPVEIELFDPARAGGKHVCDLADPFERMVAWELVELAWDQQGENWQVRLFMCSCAHVFMCSCFHYETIDGILLEQGETLDGKPFDLPEPPEGVRWTREDWALPDEGELQLTYVETPRVPRYTDVVEVEMVEKIVAMMQSRLVNDGGLRLLRLACEEFYFSAAYAGSLLGLLHDAAARVDAMQELLSRVVRHPRWRK
jgi:hypothetical protein